jgi:hypothetical protein
VEGFVTPSHLTLTRARLLEKETEGSESSSLLKIMSRLFYSYFIHCMALLADITEGFSTPNYNVLPHLMGNISNKDCRLKTKKKIYLGWWS